MMMNVHQLAEKLKVSSSCIYQWVSQGRIPFVKFGRTLRFDMDEVSKWLQDKKVSPKDIG